jgi:hypothetical protein
LLGSLARALRDSRAGALHLLPDIARLGVGPVGASLPIPAHGRDASASNRHHGGTDDDREDGVEQPLDDGGRDL